MPSYVGREPFSARRYVLRELQGLRVETAAHTIPIIEKLRKIVSFDGYTFSGLDVEGCELGAGIYLASNMSPEVTRSYSNENYLAIDPLVRLISELKPVASWHEIDSSYLNDTKVQSMCQLLNQHNIAPRTTLSFWNRGRIYGAATFTRQKPFTDIELMALGIFAPAVHSTLAMPLIQSLNLRLALSRGELTCLKFAAEGLTAEQIATESPFTLDTVTTYLKSATKKLKAANRTQAIAEAIRRKIIE